MRPLLVFGFGTCLYTRKGFFVDDRSRHLSMEYAPHQFPFDWVIVDNYTGVVSWSAPRFLMAHSNPIVHMSWNGNLYGVTSPPGPINAQVKLGQYRTCTYTTRRVAFASAFLRAKLALSQTHLDHLGILYSVNPEPFRGEVARYPESRWTDTNRLLEFEAKCANAYWQGYRDAISTLRADSGFISGGNTSYSWTRNAADPVNALLNYGYALLEARCSVAAVRAGFDPTIGQLHSISPSKHPLVFDYQKLGRVLVDLVLEFVRAKAVVRRKGAFLLTTEWGLRLAPETAQGLVQRLSFAFSRKIPGERPMTWETVLLREAQRLAEEVSTERRKPRAFEFDLPLPLIHPETLWNADLTAKIGALTVLKARELGGIPKTTLRYQQRRLREGAPLRVYRKSTRKLSALMPKRNPPGPSESKKAPCSPPGGSITL